MKKLEKIPETENKDTVKMLIFIGEVFCLVGLIIPIANLLLRAVNYKWFLKVTPVGIDMNPLGAFLFIIFGIAIWLVRREFTTKSVPIKISRALCVFIFIISTGKLIAHYLGFDLETEAYQPLYKTGQRVNIMSPNASISLMILSLAIFLMETGVRKLFHTGQFMIYFILLVAILSIYGYAYDVNKLYHLPKGNPMSFFTAACLFFFASSILFLRPHRGSMAQIIGQNPTQIVLMRFLAFVIPLVIGYLKISGTKNGLYTQEFGTAIFACITFLISMSLLGWKSNIQAKLRKEQRSHFQDIKKERKRFYNILNQTQAFINIRDVKKGKLLYFNKYVVEFLGLNEKEVEQLFKKDFKKQVERLVYKEDRDKIYKRHERIARGEMNCDEYDEIEYRMVDHKGNIKWVYSRAIPFEKKNGEVSSFLFNGSDITRQKQKEEKLDDLVKEKSKELYETKDRLDFVVHNLFDGVLHYKLKDIDSIDLSQDKDQIEEQIAKHLYIFQANLKVAKIFDVENPEDLKGKPLMDLVNFKATIEKYDILKKLIENDYRIDSMEVLHKKVDGSDVNVKISIICIIENGCLIEGWSTAAEID